MFRDFGDHNLEYNHYFVGLTVAGSRQIWKSKPQRQCRLSTIDTCRMGLLRLTVCWTHTCKREKSRPTTAMTGMPVTMRRIVCEECEADGESSDSDPERVHALWQCAECGWLLCTVHARTHTWCAPHDANNVTRGSRRPRGTVPRGSRSRSRSPQ